MNIAAHVIHRGCRPRPRHSVRGFFLVSLALWAGGGGDALPLLAAGELHVAPWGDDTNPGTETQPLASLRAARDAVRKARSDTPDADVVVWFAGGTYSIRETVVFGVQDSAPAGRTVTFAARPGAAPVFSAGRAVTGWEKVLVMPPGLPAEAQGKIWTALLPGLTVAPRAVFAGGEMMPRAQEPGFVTTRRAPGSLTWVGPENEHLQLPFPARAIRFQPNHRDVEIVLIGTAPWTMNILRVGLVDAVNSVATLAAPSSYRLTRPLFGFRRNDPAMWVENTFAGLREPGNWVIDSATARIWLWPRTPEPAEVSVAGLVEVLRIEGVIHDDLPADEPVRGLVFRGLTFTQGDRYEFHGLTGLGLQHDWERFDAATALVRLRGAEECVFERCRFVQSGGTGIRLDLHAQRNRVLHCEFSNLGAVGILLAGYGPGTKDVNRDNEVTDSLVRRCGLLYWHSPGIWAWQSGHNLIARNHVHDLPYTGIAVTGRASWNRSGRGEAARTVRWQELGKVKGDASWEVREPFLHGRFNRIEDNDIHDVVQRIHDGNGIYVSGAGRGNRLTRNFVHDLGASEAAHVEGIRCDDDQNDTTIDGNVIVRIGGAIANAIVVKGRSTIVNNVIVGAPGRRVSRGLISLQGHYIPGASIAGSRIERNIIVSDSKEQPPLGWFWPESMLRQCQVDWNLYHLKNSPRFLFFKRPLSAVPEKSRTFGWDVHSVDSDPGFMAPADDDYSLAPASGARDLGIESLTRPAKASLARPRPRRVGRVRGMPGFASSRDVWSYSS